MWERRPPADSGMRSLCHAGLTLLSADSREGLEVLIATPKTDQDSAGATVRTTCAWIQALAEHGLTAGPLLCGVDRRGRLAGIPGATLRGTGRMSGAGINLIVQRLAAAAELKGVTAHSLRAGSATTSAMAGSPAPRSPARNGGSPPPPPWTPTSAPPTTGSTTPCAGRVCRPGRRQRSAIRWMPSKVLVQGRPAGRTATTSGVFARGWRSMLPPHRPDPDAGERCDLGLRRANMSDNAADHFWHTGNCLPR